MYVPERARGVGKRTKKDGSTQPGAISAGISHLRLGYLENADFRSFLCPKPIHETFRRKNAMYAAHP